ncbi:cupredoxin domain-containing protein [Aspergillus mulundensis]|uniref:Uncharacterized protein n=1 Tax=Aspergillus mulundensis TaxID=1810919 RepID=A0A3D8SIY8_9EURO|nr:hypothetical protein DSM5745_02874 [Aspergillus mulundensis]RDW86232.1 hypothetical protein DSM5745_02874 [Aspergillus mulundensis]
MSSNNSGTSATESSRPSTATSSSAKATHTIKVGPKEDPHGYVPHSLDANVGDLIVFEFSPRNHSVVQADWKAPCIPADGDYFFSGIKNDFDEVNGQVVGALPTWNWTVERDENETRTWESQRDAALDSPYMLLPGQPMPAEGSKPGSGTSTTDHAPPPSASSSSSHGLSPGAIAGITVGAVAVVAILCGLLFVLGRNTIYRKWLSQSAEGSGGSASSAKNIRTAQWVQSSPSAGDAARSEGDAGSTGVPGYINVHGSSPVNEPAGLALGHGHGHGHGLGLGSRPATGMGFVSMDHNLPQTPPHSGVFSALDGAYGVKSPSPLGTPRPVPQQQQQQQQQPYWIWDQSIQPYHLGGRSGGPSELEANSGK